MPMIHHGRYRGGSPSAVYSPFLVNNFCAKNHSRFYVGPDVPGSAVELGVKLKVAPVVTPKPVVVTAPTFTFNRFAVFNFNLVRRQAQTVRNLRKVAAMLGITGRSAMRKDELAMEIASQDTDAEETQFAEDNAN